MEKDGEAGLGRLLFLEATEAVLGPALPVGVHATPCETLSWGEASVPSAGLPQGEAQMGEATCSSPLCKLGRAGFEPRLSPPPRGFRPARVPMHQRERMGPPLPGRKTGRAEQG